MLKTISAVWFHKVKSIGSKKIQKMLPVYLSQDSLRRKYDDA